MYGYVVPLKSELGQGDFGLYRAFYCGICKCTGKMFGQMPRFTTNYDMVFLSVLLHDYTKQEVRFANEGCILSPRKKTIVLRNDLFDKIVATNIILSYNKALDDVTDGGGMKKRTVAKMLKKHYKRAAAMLPEIDEIVTEQYNKLREFEKQNFSGVDRVADCFADMLGKIGAYLAETQEDNFIKLLYNVGKFVYLADAVDDLNEDFKKKRYNPLIAQFGNYATREQFISDNRDALTFMLASSVNRAIECFNGMVFTGASDLLKNILYKGLRGKCEELMNSNKKLPPPKI